ncbi:MAG: AraC family transcriptional regulator [Ruminococcus sp.]|nr:AraC family transcriptional regulator [Ruminococcus sp.]
MSPDMNGIAFGTNVADVFEKDGCRIMRMTSETGEGVMTLYHVFDGMIIMHNNFHMESCLSDFTAKGNFLCIDHCREGRIETIIGDDSVCCLSSGELRIDDGRHNNAAARFPLKHYYGLTIAFDLDIAQSALDSYISDFKVRLSDISEKYCSQKQPYVISSSAEISHIFSELYNVPSKIRRDYFRIKILELLLFLDALEIDRYKTDKPYFYKGQVEKVHAICELMTSDLTKAYTIEELSHKFDISPTALKKCFSSIYGSPVYTYMKNYRLERAAYLLKTAPSMKVADIAAAVGYESAGKFSAAFRKKTGSTPLDYRKYSEHNKTTPNEE